MAIDKELQEMDLISQNKAIRMPLIFLVDCSFSMKIQDGKNKQARYEELFNTLHSFLGHFASDIFTRDSMEVTIITFSETVEVLCNFVSVNEALNKFKEIKVGGLQTNLGKAVEVGLKLLDYRLELYKNTGTRNYKPNLIILTDGVATDTDQTEKMAQEVQKRLHKNSSKEGIATYCLGIGECDTEQLSKFTINDINKDSLDIYSFIDNLSRSVSALSKESMESGEDAF